MSIYATLYDFGIRRFGDNNYHLVRAQGVPGHIRYTGPAWDWLPPPVGGPVDDDTDVELPLRAVVLVEEGTAKGTPRCGQEYHDPLLILSGAEWGRISFPDLMARIEVELAKRYGRPPSIVVISRTGKTKPYFGRSAGWPRRQPWFDRRDSAFGLKACGPTSARPEVTQRSRDRSSHGPVP